MESGTVLTLPRVQPAIFAQFTIGDLRDFHEQAPFRVSSIAGVEIYAVQIFSQNCFILCTMYTITILVRGKLVIRICLRFSHIGRFKCSNDMQFVQSPTL